jgi:hypothetical protein
MAHGRRTPFRPGTQHLANHKKQAGSLVSGQF